LRDYPPEELEIWQFHFQSAISNGRSPLSALLGLEQELKARGYIQEGWWKTLIEHYLNEVEEGTL
jgi:hypothetical protein